MPITGSADLGNLIPPIVLQEARDAFQANADILPLVNVRDISGIPGKSADFPIYGKLTVTTPANETSDVTTNQVITPSFQTLTVRRQTVRVDVSDLAGAAVSGEDPSITAGRLIGNARILQVETHVLANVGTAHTSSVGATDSTAITPNDILGALLILKKNEANKNLMLAINASQEAHLLDDIVVTASSQSDRSALGQSAMSDGGLSNKELFGFKVKVTERISTGTDTNPMNLGVACNAKELGYLIKNIGAAVEFQRDASAALSEVVMNYYDSSGMTRPGAFVLVKSRTY